MTTHSLPSGAASDAASPTIPQPAGRKSARWRRWLKRLLLLAGLIAGFHHGMSGGSGAAMIKHLQQHVPQVATAIAVINDLPDLMREMRATLIQRGCRPGDGRGPALKPAVLGSRLVRRASQPGDRAAAPVPLAETDWRANDSAFTRGN